MEKGSLTATQIGVIVLIVAGFVMTLIFYSQINWTENINKDTCHSSVIYRGSLTGKLEIKDLVPLKCKTEKICVSESKSGKCSDFTKFSTIQISGNSDEDVDLKIKQTIAKEMANCWWMMGEGKVKVFVREIMGDNQARVSRKCVICSRISFDDNINEENKEVRGMVDYLMTRKVSDKDMTYWGYLTNGGSNEDLITIANVNTGTDLENLDFVDLENQKAVVYVEAQKTTWGSWFGATSGVIAWGGPVGSVSATIGSFAGPVGTGVGWVVGVGVSAISGAIIGGTAQEKITGGVDDYGSGVILVDYNPEELQKLGCDDFESIS